MQTYHHEYTGPGEDYHPLVSRDLDDLLAAYRAHRAAGEFYEHQSVLRRIQQGVPGVMAPLHCSGREVQEVVRAVTKVFIRLAEAEHPDPRDLYVLASLLDIAQPGLGVNTNPTAA